MSSHLKMATVRRTWLPEVDRGCGCCSLEVCCILQVILSLVANAVLVVGSLAVNEDNMAYCPFDAPSACSPLLIRFVSYVVFLEASVALLTVVLFLTGLCQRRAVLMKPFVVYLHWALAWNIHLCILLGVLVPIVSMFLILPILGFGIHKLLCANSLRVQIAAESSQPSTGVQYTRFYQ